MSLPTTVEEVFSVVREALASQALHGCRHGISQAAVIAAVGEPEGVDRKRKGRRVLGWAQGRLLASFEHDRLVSMHHDLPHHLPLEAIEPLLASIPHQRRDFDGVTAIDAGCIQLEVVGRALFAVHLSVRAQGTP